MFPFHRLRRMGHAIARTSNCQCNTRCNTHDIERTFYLSHLRNEVPSSAALCPSPSQTAQTQYCLLAMHLTRAELARNSQTCGKTSYFRAALFAWHEIAQWSQFKVEIFRFEAKLCGQLGDLLLQLHQRQPHLFDLLVFQ